MKGPFAQRSLGSAPNEDRRSSGRRAVWAVVVIAILILCGLAYFRDDYLRSVGDAASTHLEVTRGSRAP